MKNRSKILLLLLPVWVFISSFAPSQKEEGKSVVVAIIDTGLDLTDSTIVPALINPQTPKTLASSKAYGIDFSTGGDFCPKDRSGHGTHVAHIIHKINPKAKLLILKYHSPHQSEQENFKASLQALEYAIDQNVDIINYSGGGNFGDSWELSLFEKARKKNILVVNAAGNHSSDIDKKDAQFFPASYNLENFINVSALRQNGDILKQANIGKETVHLYTLGEKVCSSLLKGLKGALTGTSQATAIITGESTLIAEKMKERCPCTIKKNLLNLSKKALYQKAGLISILESRFFPLTKKVK